MKLKFAQDKMFVVVASGLLLLFISYFDLVTGYLISVAIFYLMPIGLVTWFVNRETGLIFSSMGALLSFSANYLGSPPPEATTVHAVNALSSFGIFLLGAVLVSQLKISVEIKERLSRIDFLTGIPNHHDFSENLFVEMERARRHERPLTLAYFDCDDYMKVNETLGREQGDLLLKEVANCLLQHTRKTDKIARMGGDEFAMMLPETNEIQAREILLRLHVKLLTLMELYKWPVTLSIGAIGFEDIPLTSQDAIRETE